jgi:hypothetical protein
VCCGIIGWWGINNTFTLGSRVGASCPFVVTEEHSVE